MSKIAHESHHAEQQGKNPEEWWDRYLVDIPFRASQEISAYQVEFKEAKKFLKDRNEIHRYLLALAMDLSGPAYGSVMTTQEAMIAIKEKKLFTFKT